MTHKTDRRDFLHFMGRLSAAGPLLPLSGKLLPLAGTLLPLAGTPACSTLRPKAAPFQVIKPSQKDDVSLAEGLTSKLFIKYNEAINDRDFFGAHNDYLALTMLPGKKDEGVMLVNHEYIHPVLIHGRKIEGGKRTREEVVREQTAMGCSLLHIKKTEQGWTWVANSKYNRRITSRTPIPFQKGYKIFGSDVAIGTLTNCAGGQTPWGTVLTCEENYDNFYGDVTFENKNRQFVPVDKFRWFDHFPLPPEHYGWVVEIEPFTGKAVKRVALGRFEHECATVKISKNNLPVVYLGEDRRSGFVYKFIGSKPGSLEAGMLYVADTEKGRWIPLDLKQNKLLKPHFDTQTDVLTYTHLAATLAGGTPQDRPEDIEIDPITGDVFVACTNNYDRKNFYGSLLKISEKNNDCESLEFTASTWMSGGPDTGIACPDNMVFDKNGNLWVTSDIADEDNNKGPYKGCGNNSLFYVPLRGEFAGKAYRIATAPVDAEFTGPMFADDCKTLFLCVQHPGAMTVDPEKPTSTWPDRKGLPKSAIVTIQGPLLDQLVNKS